MDRGIFSWLTEGRRFRFLNRDRGIFARFTNDQRLRPLSRDRGIFARFSNSRRIPPLSRDRGILSFHSRYDKGLQFASDKTTVVLRIYPESPRDSCIGRTILKVVTNTFTTVTWLECCRYGENPPKSNQYSS